MQSYSCAQLIKHQTMKTYGGVDTCIVPSQLTWALGGGEWSTSVSGRLTLGEEAHGIHWINAWVSPIAGLDVTEERQKFSTAGNRTLAYQSHSPSLYRLS
jgi:hypothetical protein